MKGEEKKALYEAITEAVLKEIQAQNVTISSEDGNLIPVGISARHVHLQEEHADILFGKGYQLRKLRDISQPGQYACEEQVTIVGPRSSIERVRILGPFRKQTQVEISRTDAIKIGVNPPVRKSGDIKNSSPITIVGPKGKIELQEGCIVADRHIHMTPADAEHFNVQNNERVSVEVGGIKGGRMDNVVIRVSDRYALEMHIDTDDANAFGMSGQEFVKLVK